VPAAPRVAAADGAAEMEPEKPEMLAIAIHHATNQISIVHPREKSSTALSGDESTASSAGGKQLAAIKGTKTRFAFDSVLDGTASQRMVFERCKPLIESAVQGYNATIFAYGQVSGRYRSQLAQLLHRTFVHFCVCVCVWQLAIVEWQR
jgi:hypothetical protein